MAGQVGWTWAQTAALLAAAIAIAGAMVTAAFTYGLNQRAARRERQAKAFAEALSAIEDYVEMPYRIRRRPGDVAARHALTEQLSEIQSRIAFHQAWLRIVAPGVADLYEAFAEAARDEAGKQMTAAWKEPVAVADAQMNLGVAYSRDQIEAARDQCIAGMRSTLGRRPPARTLEQIFGYEGRSLRSASGDATRK